MSGPDHNFVRDEDREFFERELASFVPDRVYDAHAHFSHPDFYPLNIEGLPSAIGYREYRQCIDCLHPGRSVAAMFLSYSRDPATVPLANAWTAAEIAADPACRGLFFVRPDDDPEWVRAEVRRLGLHGIKCYHLHAAEKPTWEADIPSYLPERLVKVADEEGWIITLHMVKKKAVADPGNIHWIRRYCRAYPNMKLILAHSARGFLPSHNLEGLPQLADLPNLYCDSSVNCAPHAHEAVIRFLGHKKLLYGADSLCASHGRGTTVPAADSYVWLHESDPVWEAKYGDIKPVLFGLEHLRSLKWACWSARLDDSAVEDIFWNNAAQLFGLGQPEQRAEPPDRRLAGLTEATPPGQNVVA